ncbi:F-box/FBD/LRR-repeat protein At5g53840 [Linum perenne]
MKKKEASTTGDGDGDGITEEHDQISSLPDEILHDILERLRSPKQAAKAALLSKTWKHLWLSYPVLEFYHTDYTYSAPSRSTMDSFIAAAMRKFSSSGLTYIKSVRIDSYDSAFIRAIFDLIQNREPEEIDMSLSTESVIPTLLLNSSRLRTLKLHRCKILEDQYTKMINLKELHFALVKIDIQVLNSMIAGSPLLEKLTLICLYTSSKSVPDSIQIVLGALQSLESLSLRLLSCNELEMICSSLLPSLKSLEIYRCLKVTDHVVNELISKSPSLLSLRLVRLDKVNELKIESPTLEKLELVSSEWNRQRKVVLHIDAPRLVHVYFIGSMPGISDATNSFQAAQIRSATVDLSLYCNFIKNFNFKELKEFLRKVTRLFQFVKLKLDFLKEDFIGCDQVEDDSPAPVIESVELKYCGQWELLHKQWGVYRTILDNVLWSCHPKYFITRRDHINRLPSLELINKVFVERTSPNCEQIACKCWRHQLKDVKIVNIRDTKEEELMNVSADVITNLQRENQFLFKLIWH